MLGALRRRPSLWAPASVMCRFRQSHGLSRQVPSCGCAGQCEGGVPPPENVRITGWSLCADSMCHSVLGAGALPVGSDGSAWRRLTLGIVDNRAYGKVDGTSIFSGKAVGPGSSVSPAGCIRNTTIRTGVVIAGFDYRQVQLESAAAPAVAECIAACCSDPKCEAWAVSKATSPSKVCRQGTDCCWLKNGGSIEHRAGERSCGLKPHSTDPAAAVPPSGFAAIVSTVWALMISAGAFLYRTRWPGARILHVFFLYEFFPLCSISCLRCTCRLLHRKLGNVQFDNFKIKGTAAGGNAVQTCPDPVPKMGKGLSYVACDYPGAVVGWIRGQDGSLAIPRASSGASSRALREHHCAGADSNGRAILVDCNSSSALRHSVNSGRITFPDVCPLPPIHTATPV